jgi:hypothetical protein
VNEIQKSTQDERDRGSFLKFLTLPGESTTKPRISGMTSREVKEMCARTAVPKELRGDRREHSAKRENIPLFSSGILAPFTCDL